MAKTAMTMTVTDFWASILGSAWETFPWWEDVTYVDGDWDKPGVVRVTAEDPNTDGGTVTVEVNLPMLLEAWNRSVENGWRDACTGGEMNIEDVDACVGDVVMQMAVYGAVPFG